MKDLKIGVSGLGVLHTDADVPTIRPSKKQLYYGTRTSSPEFTKFRERRT